MNFEKAIAEKMTSINILKPLNDSSCKNENTATRNTLSRHKKKSTLEFTLYI
jgi:hypothetical protein